MSWLEGITDSVDVSKLREKMKDRENWDAALHGWQRVRHD